jgi:hypothetical protein
MRAWIGHVWLRIGSSVDEHDDNISGSIKSGGYLDQLCKYQLLKKDSAMELVEVILTITKPSQRI